MPDWVKSLDNVPDNFVSPYSPQQMFIATGNERHLRHLAITADELCQCDGTGGETTPPTVTTYFPDRGETISGPPPSLDYALLIFSERVAKGSSGTVTLEGPAGVVKTWPAASSELNIIFGATGLLIEGIPTLLEGETYEFTLSAGLIQDLAGNGFTQTENWIFYTPGTSSGAFSDGFSDGFLN